MAETTKKLLDLEVAGYLAEKVIEKAEEKDAVIDEKVGALQERVDGITCPEYSLVKAETAEEGYTASYNLTKDGVKTGATINIPKDYLVKSASIKECEEADAPVAGYQVGDKYIDFVVNTSADDGNEAHIYLAVNELVDVYTAGDGIVISIGNVVSIVAQDGTQAVGGITKADYESFKATVTESATNKENLADVTSRVESLERVEYATTADIDAMMENL